MNSRKEKKTETNKDRRETDRKQLRQKIAKKRGREEGGKGGKDRQTRKKKRKKGKKKEKRQKRDKKKKHGRKTPPPSLLSLSLSLSYKKATKTTKPVVVKSQV